MASPAEEGPATAILSMDGVVEGPVDIRLSTERLLVANGLPADVICTLGVV